MSVRRRLAAATLALSAVGAGLLAAPSPASAAPAKAAPKCSVSLVIPRFFVRHPSYSNVPIELRTTCNLFRPVFEITDVATHEAVALVGFQVYAHGIAHNGEVFHWQDTGAGRYEVLPHRERVAGTATFVTSPLVKFRLVDFTHITAHEVTRGGKFYLAGLEQSWYNSHYAGNPKVATIFRKGAHGWLKVRSFTPRPDGSYLERVGRPGEFRITAPADRSSAAAKSPIVRVPGRKKVNKA